MAIDKQVDKANEIFREYRLLDAVLTAEKFKELFLELTSRKDFLKFYEYEMNLRRTQGQIEQSTFKSHQNTLLKLKKFTKGAPLPFADLNERWINRFNNWLRNHLKGVVIKSGKQQINNSLNTIHIAHKNIKTYLAIAEKDEAIRFDNPYKHGNPSRQVRGHREVLSSEELKAMIDLYEKEQLTRTQRSVLARFICSCFTGVRISDQKEMTMKNVKDGHLIFKPKKTRRMEKEVLIPLTEAAIYFMKEIEKEGYEQISDQKSNMHLKGLAALAKIDKNVTMHVARHTFATLFLILGGQLPVLQEILGHADIKTTMVYVKMTENHKKEQIQVMDQIFKNR